MSGIDPTSLPARFQKQIADQLYGTKQPVLANPAKPKARIRQKQGDGLNQTERAFLAHLQANPEYDTVAPHALTLKLGNGVHYTPDFIAYHQAVDPYGDTDHVYAFEVKGFMRDDAAVKLKVAASLFPWIKFSLATKKKDGSWDVQRVFP